MKFKFINCLGGLPRSGSTLLATLLNQHPKIYASPHSPLLEGLWSLRDSFVNSESIQYGLRMSAAQKTLWTMPQHYYQDVEKDIIFDKQFAWSTPDNYEMATKISPFPRFVLTYRPILEVMASFVVKSIDNPDYYLNKHLESKDFWPKNYLSKNDAMAEYLMTGHGLLPMSILGLANAKQNESTGQFKFIAYDDLVNNPQKTINEIFDFVQVESMEIKVSNIENVFRYHDTVPIGVGDFHWVRSEIKKESPKPEDLFSDYILSKYKNALAPIGL
jgi:hypothetical protein